MNNEPEAKALIHIGYIRIKDIYIYTPPPPAGPFESITANHLIDNNIWFEMPSKRRSLMFGFLDRFDGY